MSPRRNPSFLKAGASLGDDDVVRDWSLAPEDVAEVMRARGAEHRLRFRSAALCPSGDGPDDAPGGRYRKFPYGGRIGRARMMAFGRTP
jgi:hypothetical protein